MKSLYGLLVLLISGIASGGTISGGGGVLHGDRGNPWFLENTRDVRYCIEHDPAAFHADLDVVKSSIVTVINSWKNRLATMRERYSVTLDTIQPYGMIRIGTQNFILEEDCREETDLRFQLGVLSDPQKALLGQPKDYVAASIRTDYDRINLRGKGFIYFAADAGPLRPDSEFFAERPWELFDGAIFRVVLSHELSHIFGLPHQSGRDSMGTVTHERIPDIMTNRNYIEKIASSPTGPEVFDKYAVELLGLDFPDQGESSWCGSDQAVRFKFLEVPKGHSCFKMTWNVVYSPGQVRQWNIKFLSAVSEQGEWHPLGHIERERGGTLAQTSMAEIWMPKEQRVFSKLEEEFIDHYQDTIDGLEYEEFPATYIAENGARKSVTVSLFPDGRYAIAAVVDGKIYANVLRH